MYYHIVYVHCSQNVDVNTDMFSVIQKNHYLEITGLHKKF